MEPDEKIKQIRKKYEKHITEAKKKTAKQMAQIIPEVIKLRTRQEGQGSKGRPLKKLAESTIKQREKYSSNLHEDTSPSQSNLTATGQMLDAITGKVDADDKVSVYIKQTSRNNELNGSESKLSNKAVAKLVEENGRPFLELSKSETKERDKLATDILVDELKRLLQ